MDNNCTDWKKILGAWYSVQSALDLKLTSSVKDDLLFLFGKKYPDIKSVLKESKSKTLSAILSKGVWYDEGLRYLEVLNKNKISYTYLSSKDYPQNLYKLPDPPFFLSYIGKLCWNDMLKLSVVGSRNPSLRSLRWMEDNLSILFESGICSVSGGALGIDQKTHNISIRLKKPTIAVLPSGIGNVYPKLFVPVIDDILACGGMVVSEYPLDAVMYRSNFHNRNRLIAALGDTTLIVEARIRSGTMITANKSIDIGQKLAVIPAHPTESKSNGNVKLLMDGIPPVRDAEDLIVMMNPA